MRHKKEIETAMVPHMCRACGHVFGENNAFVLKSHCCPQCGSKVSMKRKGPQPWRGIAVAAGLLVVIVTVYVVTSSLLQL